MEYKNSKYIYSMNDLDLREEEEEEEEEEGYTYIIFGKPKKVSSFFIWPCFFLLK